MSKKPYYPNNWKAYKDTPDELFDSIEYEDFMTWKIAGWEIPSSVQCIIRERNLRTGKISEKIYARKDAAENALRRQMEQGESEFVVCHDSAIVNILPEDYYEEDY
tara:strand:- start:220 stop:537 length:318 start_codon:yes stop_codon:yes gene_type:complete